MMRTVLAIALLALTACGTEPMRKVQAFFQPAKGQEDLSIGLKHYENGRYVESLKSLQSAIQQGLGDSDRVTAHKHAAFIHCASSRHRACREEFRRALAVNPAMELAPEEADHPIWGPVFRSLKAGR